MDGEWYLPDFYLNDFMLFVEIKPFDKKIVSNVGDNNEWEKLCRKFRDLTGKAILLCYDEPAKDVYKMLFAFDTTDSGGGCSEFYALFTTYDCKTVLVTAPTRSDRDIFIDEDLYIQSDYVGTPYNFAKDRWLLWDRAMECLDVNGTIPEWDITSSARLKARQARFEHGEKPNIKKERK